MGPKSRQNAAEHDLFRMELVNLIDQRHELVKLAALIDWPAFEQAWGPKFESTTGRPALPTRLLISHTRGLPPSLKKLLKRRQAIEPTTEADPGAPAGASLGPVGDAPTGADRRCVVGAAARHGCVARRKGCSGRTS